MQKLAQLQALEEQQAAQQAELAQYAESDPERYQQMSKSHSCACYPRICVQRPDGISAHASSLRIFNL